MTEPQPDPYITKALTRMEESRQRRESAKVYQLALWGEVQRGVPNEFARSALFAAIQGKGQKYLSKQTLFSQNGFAITYTGIRLTQAHLDVFEGIMHIARGTSEGNHVRFSAHGLLKLIGRSTGRSDHQWLQRTLEELTATSVAITRDDSTVYWGSLLPEGAGRIDDGRFVVTINRQIIKLFERGFTVIEWEQRKALKRKPLAQSLHLWISSHIKPYPVTVQYLHDITGSETKQLKHFRSNLKNALDELKAVGVIAAWHIDQDDKIYLEKI